MSAWKAKLLSGVFILDDALLPWQSQRFDGNQSLASMSGLKCLCLTSRHEPPLCTVARWCIHVLFYPRTLHFLSCPHTAMLKKDRLLFPYKLIFHMVFCITRMSSAIHNYHVRSKLGVDRSVFFPACMLPVLTHQNISFRGNLALLSGACTWNISWVTLSLILQRYFCYLPNASPLF